MNVDSHRVPWIVALALVLAGLAPLWAADDAKPEFKIEGGKLVLPSPIEFKTGSATPTQESDKAIKHIAAFLKAKESITLLRVECHTDNQGKPDDNLALSCQRALAVAKKVAEQGVDCKRLIAVGFGGDKPVESNDTPQGRSMNRRVEARMAAMRGKPIGGLPVDGGGKPAGDVCEKEGKAE